MDGFHYTSFAQEIIFAPGALAQLHEAVERFGWRRILLCTSQSMQRNGYVNSIKSSLGDVLVAAFDYVQPHVQDVQVKDTLRLAEENNADAVIGKGGYPLSRV